MTTLKEDENKVRPQIINISHRAGSTNLKVRTLNKTYTGGILWCFEVPHVPYSKRRQF